MKQIDLSLPKSAIFSEDRRYRYVLWRVWSQTRRPLLMIGLNPSTANEISDDPTITRMMVRANKAGYGSLVMTNLYAFVSSNPDVLLEDGDFIGIETDAYLIQAIQIADRVICGWGSFPAARKRADYVLKMIPQPYCLGVNIDGQPKHPLYLSYDTPVVKFRRQSSGFHKTLEVS